MSTVVPAFGQAVVAHREAASHLEAAYALMAAGQRFAQNDAAGLSYDTELRRIATQLAAQRGSLATLSGQLQVAQPGLEGILPSKVGDITEAIARANDCARLAEDGIGTAQRQVMAPLFPAISPMARALLVYCGWGLACWLVQCGLLVGTNGTNANAIVISLCGMPVLAFAASYLTLEVFGQPRVGTRHKYSLKLGGAICFLGMPVAWILLVTGLAIVR